MAKRLKSWNSYVAEANREPVEIDLGHDGVDDVITVQMPSSGAIRRLNRAQRAGDEDAALVAIFGEKNAAKLWAAAEDSPPGALQSFIQDVLQEFGLSPNSGEASASSTS